MKGYHAVQNKLVVRSKGAAGWTKQKGRIYQSAPPKGYKKWHTKTMDI